MRQDLSTDSVKRLINAPAGTLYGIIADVVNAARNCELSAKTNAFRVRRMPWRSSVSTMSS